MQRCSFICCFLVGMVAPAASANLIVNFNSPGTEGFNYVGQGAYSDPGDNHWNTFVQNGTTGSGATKLSNGTATTISMTETNAGGGFFEGNANGLLDTWDIAKNATATFRINNLPSGTYTLYIYGVNGDYGDFNSGGGRATQYAITSLNGNTVGLPASEFDTGNTNLSFSEGNNYVVFTNLTLPSGGSISGTYVGIQNGDANSPSDTEGQLNGLQIVAVPEPMNLALLCAAGLPLLARRGAISQRKQRGRSS